MKKAAAFIFMVLALQTVALHAAGRIVILGLFRDKAIFEVDGRSYTLARGQTSNGVTLIAANSKEAIIEIDGVRNSYTLGVHIGSNFHGPAPGTTVTIAPDSRGMFMVNGSINNHQARFMVDTGATLVAMNRHEASRFGIDYKLTGEQAVSSTAGGYQTIYIVRLDNINIGGIRLEDVPAAVHDGDFPDIILLGNSFLNNVTIKREGQLLQLIK